MKKNKIKILLNFAISYKKSDFINCSIPILNDKTLITKEFPLHTSFSILPSKCFKVKKGVIENNQYIQKVQNKLKLEIIKIKSLIQELNNLFPPKHSLSEEKNTFLIAGHFDDCFEVNPSYCRWLNNKNLFYYYYENGEKKQTNVKSKLI